MQKSGYEGRTSPNAQLVNNMLEKAPATLRPGEYPIIHSDRGCHYRLPDWIKRGEDAGLTRSMSRKEHSPDNSDCEGFFGQLKSKMFYGRSWVGCEPVGIQAKSWIDLESLQDFVCIPFTTRDAATIVTISQSALFRF